MKQKLPDNLTLEDFNRLAAREPNLDGPWRYELSRIVITCDYWPLPYPKFDVYDDKTESFSSLKDAETEMRKWALNKEDGNPAYCFQIYQEPIDGELFTQHGARWLYDGQGNLLDYTITADEGDVYSTTFFGRPESRNRFKTGDIVEVFGRYNEVHLALYVSNPPSSEKAYSIYQKQIPRGYYAQDSSDDTAYLLTGGHFADHEHVSPVNIMKPRFPISSELEAEIKSWLTKAEQNTEEYSPQQMSHGLRELVDEFWDADISINYGKNVPVPYLHISDGDKFHVRLRIDRPEYFDANGIQSTRLTDLQKEALMIFFETVGYGRNQWWYCLREANYYDLARGYKIPMDTPLPDYRKLN